MSQSQRRDRRGWWTLTRSGLILPGLLAGCGAIDGNPWWRIDNCATIPKGAIPAPYGTHLNTILKGQEIRAEAEDFVIQKHEWYLGGREPGPYGRRHLAVIAQRLPGTPFPVVVEPVEPEELKGVPPTDVAQLNESRRRGVVEYLLARNVADAEQRVVLGQPTAEGLYGDAAERIGARYLLGQGGTAGTSGAAGGFGNVSGGIGSAGGFGGGLGGLGGGVGGFGSIR